MQQQEGSFRDPSGFIFYRETFLYRQINQSYQEHYLHLLNSGLYQVLFQEGFLVSHQEVLIEPFEPLQSFKIIQPERIPFISYPYEWCFSQLKAAALLTLKIQQKALAYGMTLKDASAYNIQWLKGKPIWIDTLSFEKYQDGTPWNAYRQFCQHFLAPLVLIRYRDVRLQCLLRRYLDGVPLDLASRLLPWYSWMSFSMLSHLHLHALFQQKFSEPSKKRSLSRFALYGLIDHLEKTIAHLCWKPPSSEWSNYETEMNYTVEAFQQKEKIVSSWIQEIRPSQVWDFGANHGYFSRLASQHGAFTLAVDADPILVERHYLETQSRSELFILPLNNDLMNPSPDLGWNLRERESLIRRGPADLVLVLALVHHLAIAQNVPLQKIAFFLSQISRSLIIEFVPKDDSQVSRLLSTREDIFPTYTQKHFEEAFQDYFTILQRILVPESLRTLYWMKRVSVERIHSQDLEEKEN
ncbi:MAG: SAM-dependent methyltransferase [Planctomycetota bacterium]